MTMMKDKQFFFLGSVNADVPFWIFESFLFGAPKLRHEKKLKTKSTSILNLKRIVLKRKKESVLGIILCRHSLF